MHRKRAIARQGAILVARSGTPALFGAVCIWFLAQRFAALDPVDVAQSVRSVLPLQWGAAALATAISFWAVGRYDAVLHRHLRTGISDRGAARAGVVSIALSQMLGLGLLTGSIARWRMLPTLSFAQSLHMTTVVALSFLAGWAVVTAIVSLPFKGLPLWVALAVLILAAGLIACASLKPDISLFGRRMRLPSLPALSHILRLTAVDTIAAAFALWLLLPQGADIAFTALLPAYLLAYGAGMISGTPGGIGAFELTLAAFLPSLPEADLISTVVAFRLLYFALPACLAIIALARPMADRGISKPLWTTPARHIEAVLMNAPRSECGILRQNAGAILTNGHAAAATIETAQTVTALFDPLHGSAGQMAKALSTHAENANKVHCYYKISARQAISLRAQGYAVLRVAEEAVITPRTFTVDGAGRRQLRRKLRAAERAGISVGRAAHLPEAAMAQVDTAWRSKNGAARGVSMGYFEAGYLRRQTVYLAYQGQALVAFASFHESAAEMCLDLMRLAPDAPDGTMHALIHAAIMDACARDVPRLTLAAVPTLSAHSPLEARLRRLLAARTGGTGLTQFKASFAPVWQPLYAASEGRMSLALCLFDLARSILSAAPERKKNGAQTHDDNDQYEFASPSQT